MRIVLDESIAAVKMRYLEKKVLSGQKDSDKVAEMPMEGTDQLDNKSEVKEDALGLSDLQSEMSDSRVYQPPPDFVSKRPARNANFYSVSQSFDSTSF